MKGILMAYWSGRKTAEAITDVLDGDYNPDGRLPYSYPRSMGEMVLYDRKPTEDVREIFNSDMNMSGYDPLFPFGWGLSYTTFAYGPIHLGSPRLNGTGKLEISITVNNTGSRDGKHTVELYTREYYASITPNMRRLRAFKKLSLKAGETQTVSFTLDRNDLAFVNARMADGDGAGRFRYLYRRPEGEVHLCRQALSAAGRRSVTPFLHDVQVCLGGVQRRLVLVRFLLDDKITGARLPSLVADLFGADDAGA